MSGLHRLLRWLIRVGLPVGALLLHFCIVVFYVRRWDHAAAVTVFPLWAWGFLGLGMAGLSWIVFRTRWALGVALLWLATIIVGSDETKPLLRVSAARPAPGLPPDHEGKRVLRVVTLNCARNPFSAEEVLPWQPDIVLLQEVPYPQVLLALANKLYPDGKPQEHVLGGYDCGVVTRGKKKTDVAALGSGVPPSNLRVLPCCIELDGQDIHLVCVHLQGAVTSMSLQHLETWKMHYWNRQSRRAEMINVRQWMETLNLTQMDPANPVPTSAPVIIAGDFNAPAGDAVFRELEPNFKNAFDAVGSGWSDTFPNFAPMLRIDHIYTTAAFAPLSAITVKTTNSDHRMVVADFVLN